MCAYLFVCLPIFVYLPICPFLSAYSCVYWKGKSTHAMLILCRTHRRWTVYLFQFYSLSFFFLPFLFVCHSCFFHFMGASIVCVTNLDRTVDSVLWFPEKTSDWKTLGTKKTKNILCSQYFTSIKISTQMVCFLCCQIMCTSISRPTLERERRGGEQTLRPYSSRRIASARHVAWMSGLALKWVRLAPNLDKSGIFQIRFQ